MRTPALFGSLPVEIGNFPIATDEMMAWLYCPIKYPNGPTIIPPNLAQYFELVSAVYNDLPKGRLDQSYVYITAKTLWVTPENPGNRPGWHSDGFLTDDLNYIWCDSNPTIFWNPPEASWSFEADHVRSLSEMNEVCSSVGNLKRYPINTLLKLDQYVMHRTEDDFQPGFRTFVKISVSYEKYTIQGSSRNYQLPDVGPRSQRSSFRNCPHGLK